MRTGASGTIKTLVVTMLLALALGAGSAHAAQRTIDFDDRPELGPISTQYAALGVTDFGADAALKARGGDCSGVQATASVGSGAAPPSRPRWAEAVNRVNGSGVEFPDYTICARFAEPQTAVSYTLALDVSAYALRQDGTTIGPVVQAPGRQTLSAGSGSPIKGILLRGSPSSHPQVAIDDLTFTTSTTVSPEVDVQPDSSLGVRQGSEAKQVIRVRHRNGDSSATAFGVEAGSFPPGVTGTVSPGSLPASSEDQTVTVTLTASRSVAPTDFAYRLNVLKGSTFDRLDVPTHVTPGVLLEYGGGTAALAQTVGTAATSLDSCAAKSFGLRLRVPPSESPPQGPVFVEVTPGDLPAGAVDESEPQVLVTPPADGSAIDVPRRVGFAPRSAVVTGTLVASARPIGVDVGQARLTLPVSVEPTVIGGVRELGEGLQLPGPHASVPRWDRPGDRLEITGRHLCPGSTALVGAASVARPASVSADQTTATVALDASATPTGFVRALPAPPLGVRLRSSRGGEVSAGADFQLPRASSQFAFANTAATIPYQRWVETFGAATTQVSYDPCAGSGKSCSKTVPDPIAYATWVANYTKTGQGGLCFGHVELTDFYERGRLARAAAASPGREGVSDNYSVSDALTPALDDELQRHYITVTSASYDAVLGPAETTFAAAVAHLQGILAGRNDAWVTIFDTKAGHIVRAYAISSLTDDEAVVEVEDSNVPFTPDETTDPAAHAARTASSRLTLKRTASGGVQFALPGSGFTGGEGGVSGSLQFTDPADVPATFDSPLGSSSAPPGAVVSASTTGADAVLVDVAGAPVPGQAGAVHPGGLGHLDPRDLSVSATEPVFLQAGASEDGSLGQVVRRAGTLAALSSAPVSGQAQRLGVMPDGTAMAPAGTGTPHTLSVSRGLGKVQRMVQIDAPAALGTQVKLGAGGADVRAVDGSGAVELRLTTVTAGSAAATVTLPGVRLARGDRLKVPRSAFRGQLGARVALRLVHRGRTRTLRPQVRAGGRLVTGLRVKVTGKAIRAKLRIGAVDADAAASVRYVVRRGRRVVARGAAGVDPATGAATLPLRRKLRRGDVIEVTGLVRAADGTLSGRTRRVSVR